MKSIPCALRDVAKAFDALAQAYEAQGHADVVRAKTKIVEPPRIDLAAAKAIDVIPDREGLTKTETKILTALAQAGRPLSLTQIGTRSGLSSGAGSFAQAVASLRADGFAEGPGSALAITDDGLEELGPFSGAAIRSTSAHAPVATMIPRAAFCSTSAPSHPLPAPPKTPMKKKPTKKLTRKHITKLLLRGARDATEWAAANRHLFLLPGRK